MGLRAEAIHSENPTDHARIEAAFLHNDVDILLITPERFANQRFSTQVLSPVAGQISLLVIDEAHCISDWGHDFRPHYRLLERIVRTLPPNLRLLATTATANDRVMDDLMAVLGPKLDIFRGDLNRQCVTIAEALRPAGYRTAMSGKWHVTPWKPDDKHNWPLQRGFADRRFRSAKRPAAA